MDILTLLSHPPAGFRVVNPGVSSLEIEYRRTGMKAMNGFLIVWLTIWTVACGFLLHGYLSGATMDDGSPMPLWFVGVFWLAELAVAWLLIYLLFCRRRFRLDTVRLTIETRVLVFRWQRSLEKSAIQEFRQVQDGGKGDDSFPSWGLKAAGDRTLTLIYRQPLEKSEWLGSVLAAATDRPFQRVAGIRAI